MNDPWPDPDEPISTRDALRLLAASVAVFMGEAESRESGIRFGPAPSDHMMALSHRLRLPEPKRCRFCGEPENDRIWCCDAAQEAADR